MRADKGVSLSIFVNPESRGAYLRVFSLLAIGELVLGALALTTLPRLAFPVASLDQPVLAGSIEAKQPVRGARGPDLGPYRGLGAWVDMFDDWPWDDPTGSVEDMKRHGVRTLFLQTSNHQKKGTFFNRGAIGEFLRAAHARDIQVVAWYVPSFLDLERDFGRIKAAIEFRTSDGHRFDSFALDIEDDSVYPVSLRNKRLLQLTGMIRGMVGRSYALGAIVPDPIRFDSWPDFPYAAVARHYDVLVPMQYFSEWTSGYEGALAHTAEGIRRIRAATKDTSTPIHVIGGIASGVDLLEMRGFVKALRRAKVFGYSLYDFPIMASGHWSTFAGLQEKRGDGRRARKGPETPIAEVAQGPRQRVRRPPALPTLPSGETVSQLLHPSLRR